MLPSLSSAFIISPWQYGHFFPSLNTGENTRDEFFTSSTRLDAIFLISLMKASGSSLPLLMASSLPSHFPVSSGDFSTSGASLTTSLPLGVGTKYFPCLSTYLFWTSFSIMSALVAGVPRPEVRFDFSSSSSTNLPACSMAERRVASVYLSGGVVELFLTLTLKRVTSSPSLRRRRAKESSPSSTTATVDLRPELSATLL